MSEFACNSYLQILLAAQDVIRYRKNGEEISLYIEIAANERFAKADLIGCPQQDLQRLWVSQNDPTHRRSTGGH